MRRCWSSPAGSLNTRAHPHAGQTYESTNHAPNTTGVAAAVAAVGEDEGDNSEEEGAVDDDGAEEEDGDEEEVDEEEVDEAKKVAESGPGVSGSDELATRAVAAAATVAEVG